MLEKVALCWVVTSTWFFISLIRYLEQDWKAVSIWVSQSLFQELAIWTQGSSQSPQVFKLRRATWKSFSHQIWEEAEKAGNVKKMKRANRNWGKRFYNPNQKESQIKYQNLEELNQGRSNRLGFQRLLKCIILTSSETYIFSSLVPWYVPLVAFQ